MHEYAENLEDCTPGCACMTGYVFDTSRKACVLPENCSCHHGGKSYSDGDKIKEDCNLWWVLKHLFRIFVPFNNFTLSFVAFVRVETGRALRMAVAPPALSGVIPISARMTTMTSTFKAPATMYSPRVLLIMVMVLPLQYRMSCVAQWV